MRKPLAALVIALLIPALSMQSALAVKSGVKTSAVAWSQLTASTQVWILGSQIHAYECLTKPTKATLFLQAPTGWVEAASTVAALDPKLCPNGSARYAAKYEFILRVEGQQDFPGTHAKLLIYQIAYTQGSSHSGASAIYDGSDEISEDQLDGKLPGTSSSEESDQPVQIVISSKPVQSRSSSSPLASATSSPRVSAGWNGCSFNGVPMFGRVKVVSVGARFKIRIVGGKAALRVKGVPKLAKKCGEWQFVSATPAFTVQIVRAGEDFTVSLGTGHPGVTN